MIRKLLHRPFFIRLLNWEYWPFHIVYGPIYFYWLWLCIRSRSFFFFNTSNPSIKNGGFLMESKWQIYNLLPAGTYPSTVFFNRNSSAEKILTGIKNNRLQFPMVGKPDIGMQGKSVQKLENVEELLHYARQSRVDFLVQEFVPFRQEAGIFYYRLPGEKKGHISGIVGKEFLKVTGDGVSNIASLLKKDKRYILQLRSLQKIYGNELQKILPRGEEFILVPYGNHVRGAKFIDISHLADEQLEKVIDGVCGKVTGFYYGRLDIRYNSWEELRRGINFSIIELNGAGSEPTHIYDPKHSIFFAWKEIIRHLNLLYRISKMNYDKTHRPYMDLRSGLGMLRQNRNYVKLISEV